MALDTAFWILAVVSVVSALAVVFLKDVFRAALFLVLCFFTVAGIYVTLDADFLAAVQVLVYVGAVAILIIFAILFTREARQGSLFNKLKIPALLFAVVLLGTMIYTITTTDWSVTLGPNADVPLADLQQGGSGLTGSLSQALFSENGFLLPVEIAGALLLVAVLGGIVIMRDKDQ